MPCGGPQGTSRQTGWAEWEWDTGSFLEEEVVVLKGKLGLGGQEGEEEEGEGAGRWGGIGCTAGGRSGVPE